MNLIHDQQLFNSFTQNVLPPLQDGEVYFLSLSARNKYLAKEERERFKLDRTEMFSRTLCRGNWDYAMSKMTASLSYKTTKSGLPFPKKALVVYVNINPSSMASASLEFAKNVMNVSSEMLKSYRNGKTPNLKQLDKADRLLMNYIQKSKSVRYFLDIDVDAPVELAEEMSTALYIYGLDHYKIRTKGGMHFLIRRDILRLRKCPLHEIVNEYNATAKELYGGEVIFNSNAMIPVPGTYQANFPVGLID